jgi:hypothetical protein
LILTSVCGILPFLLPGHICRFFAYCGCPVNAPFGLIFKSPLPPFVLTGDIGNIYCQAKRATVPAGYDKSSLIFPQKQVGTVADPASNPLEFLLFQRGTGGFLSAAIATHFGTQFLQQL